MPTQAIKDAVARGLNCYGPIPADTVFLRAMKAFTSSCVASVTSVQGEFDAVIAMYHDQGHIPAKLAGFGDTVNVTLGDEQLLLLRSKLLYKDCRLFARPWIMERLSTSLAMAKPITRTS